MATIRTALAPTIVTLLGNLVADEVGLYLGLNHDIRKLMRKIDGMKEVIKEYEQSAVQDADTKNWLKLWKDIMYDTEDIIDLCRIEAERRGATWPRFRLERQVSSVLNCKVIDVDCKIARAIRKLNTSAEEISRTRPARPARGVAMADRTARSYLCAAPELHPITVGADIEKTTNNLVELLMRDGSNISLFAVVGSIGVGKSAFAGKIYHNHRICAAFPSKIWICPCRNSSDITIWQGTRSEVAREEQLRDIIAGRKFLLVVDDLWTYDFWDRLSRHIRQCSPGSRVIITTRYINLARRIGVPRRHIYQVKKLDEDDGWSLLQKEVSVDGIDVTKDMQEIGRRIVQKCDGLPMAIYSISGALRERDSKAGWENVYQSDFLKLSADIQAAINLSYEDLEPYQKQCFLYCGLFPPGFVFEKNYITQQWISQGFVEVNANNTPEELAEVYFMELITKGLLQMEEGTDTTMRAKMPHILQSFAQDLSKDDSSSGDIEHLNDTFEPRHLAFTHKSIPVRNEISKLKKLRTLLLFQNECEPGGLEEHLRKLTLLRVLDLHSTPIEAVPTTLGRLWHLRYLNLSETKIRVLPDTIRYLKTLQYLILKGCPLKTLPRGIGQLKKLRSLDILGTEVNTVDFSFKQLKELNCLRGFLVTTKAGEPDGWPLQEVSALSKLTSLHILRIEKCLTSEDAGESVLSEKCHLKELELCCSGVGPPMEVPQEVERIEGIFQRLQPPTCIESLKLENYNGHQYPLYMRDLVNLQRLDLCNCLHCEALPALGELPQLRFLSITTSIALRAIGTELRGDTQIAFPELKYMKIERMFNLKSWSELQDVDMPLLQKFEIKSCPSLVSLPSVIAHSTALTTLRIEDYGYLEEVKNLPALKKLTVVNNRNLKELSALPELEVLEVNNCQKLNTLKDATSLRRLQIASGHLQDLPKWLAQHTSMLQRLEIAGTTLDENTLLFSYTRSTSMAVAPIDSHLQRPRNRRITVRNVVQVVKEYYGVGLLSILFLCASQYIITMAVPLVEQKI